MALWFTSLRFLGLEFMDDRFTALGHLLKTQSARTERTPMQESTLVWLRMQVEMHR